MSNSLHFFVIPALHAATAQEELNLFLSQHRVLTVEKQWLAAGADSYWAVCVSIISGQAALPSALKLPGNKTSRAEKIDYREVLEPDDFVLFAKLRALRQTIAMQEGVPPYALFTNEQLATMAKLRPVSAQALRSIAGVGDARVTKYGAEFVQAMQPAT